MTNNVKSELDCIRKDLEAFAALVREEIVTLERIVALAEDAQDSGDYANSVNLLREYKQAEARTCAILRVFGSAKIKGASALGQDLERGSVS
jgi:hypothetical protein